jgi:hypothetical protein
MSLISNMVEIDFFTALTAVESGYESTQEYTIYVT